MQSYLKSWKQISLTNTLIIVGFFLEETIALQCFGCGATTGFIESNNQKIVIPACSNFDGTSKFFIECPFSTMCVRTVHTMYSINGRNWRTIELGCAQQKQSQHVLRNKIWELEHSVREIYPEDCITMEDEKGSKMNCYCRGHLCNLASVHIATTSVVFFIALFVCLLL